MSRRTRPQKKTDDAAFPVRMFLRVPEYGFGARKVEIYEWLTANLGRGEYAIHGGGRHPGVHTIDDRIAVYVRHPRAAVALLQAFPDLELSDGLESGVYTSPDRPLGGL